VAKVENLAAAGEFAQALSWVIAGGYALMFIGMVVEGPVITAAAGFAAALGYFNFWIVLALAVAGDLIGDFIYYAIGYMSRVTFVEKYGVRFGITKARMKKLEGLIKAHPKKTMVAIKLSPFLPTPGLMMMGAVRMSLEQFSEMALAVTIPKAILFTALGFYFGRAYDTIAHYIQNGEYFIVIAIVVLLVVYYLYKKAGSAISLRLERI
jgi:membrane protein DedA with SNARE-associated domain